MSRVGGDNGDTLTARVHEKAHLVRWSFFKKNGDPHYPNPVIRFTRTVNSMVFVLRLRDARSFHQARWGLFQRRQVAGSRLGVCGSICVGDQAVCRLCLHVPLPHWTCQLLLPSVLTGQILHVHIRMWSVVCYTQNVFRRPFSRL